MKKLSTLGLYLLLASLVKDKEYNVEGFSLAILKTTRMLKEPCQDGYENVSVEGNFNYCTVQPVCYGSIHGSCPGPQEGLPDGSFCGIVMTGILGCKVNAPPTIAIPNSESSGSNENSSSGSPTSTSSSTSTPSTTSGLVSQPTTMSAHTTATPSSNTVNGPDNIQSNGNPISGVTSGSTNGISTSTSSGGVSTMALVGIVVGALFAVALILFGVIMRRKKKTKEAISEPQPPTIAEAKLGTTREGAPHEVEDYMPNLSP